MHHLMLTRLRAQAAFLGMWRYRNILKTLVRCCRKRPAIVPSETDGESGAVLSANGEVGGMKRSQVIIQMPNFIRPPNYVFLSDVFTDAVEAAERQLNRQLTPAEHDCLLGKINAYLTADAISSILSTDEHRGSVHHQRDIKIWLTD